MRRAVIIGDGLAGALQAVLLARAGWRVAVYERRPDPRAAGYAGGRSINLALSARGLAGLRAADLEQTVMERDAIPMRGRMVHATDGRTTFQPYSKNPADAINSVSRGGLNLTLITAAGACPGVELFFEHLCVDADLVRPAAVLKRADGSEIRVEGDLLIGADGAFSAVRGVMQKSDRFDYAQSYLGHGYKELRIPPGDGVEGHTTSVHQDVEGVTRKSAEGAVTSGRFVMEPNALHIWPRGGAMMIALPNRDGSFTCTLFWPWEGEHSFANLEGAQRIGAGAACGTAGRGPSEEDRRRVIEFFRREYSDAVPLMPTLAEDFFRNPTSSLVTVRCWPWQSNGKVVLVGDAAHAIVPFYGQGINAGFEDCVALTEALKTHRDQREALEAYQAERKPNTEAIADMALENFVEMRDKVGRPEFLYRKKIEQTLHALFPGQVEPQYNLVSFSTVPYAEARRRGRELERVIDAVAAAAPPGSIEALGEDRWREKVRAIGASQLASSCEAASAGVCRKPEAGTRLLDISPSLSPRIAVFPGDTPLTREVLMRTEDGAPITLSTLRTTVHAGAHADAPSHYGRGAATMERMPPDVYLGPCRVIGVRARRGQLVRTADLPDGERTPITTPRVLLRTGTFPDPEHYNTDFAAMSVELVDWLASRGVKLVGIDTPSVDPSDSKTLPAHAAFLRHGMVIVEGLVLKDVPDGEYELIALPLKLEGFDASPVRAVLRER